MGREFNVADKLMLSNIYKEHQLFKELDEMMDFYETVSDRAFCFLPSGTKGFPNYESYYFMSIQGSLDSIKTLLKIARINDAFVLARKVFDDILTEIYLDITLKDKFDIKKNLYVEDVQKWIESSFRIPSVKNVLKAIKILHKLRICILFSDGIHTWSIIGNYWMIACMQISIVVYCLIVILCVLIIEERNS